jgi:arsenical pump membrane protein
VFAAALSQAWPPFVLVAGLLVIGAVAHRDGLFDRLGGLLDALPGPPAVRFAAACLLLAVVTALLNLDTAVVFVMPTIVLAARRRGISAMPFVYATLFMANASSLYLPGSNLTNLLVLADQPGEHGFAAHMLAPALVATLVTAAGLAFAFRRSLRTGGPGHAEAPSARAAEPSGRAAEPSDRAAEPPGRLIGLGGAGALAAAVCMVLLTNPALEVAAVAVILAALARLRGRVSFGELVDAASPQVLLALLALAVALGVLARAWDGPEHLLAHAGRIETSGVAALATVLINNLPAAVMLSAHAVPHPRALLIGLNLGPNLAVTGSLAAFLWMRTAAQLEVATSIRRLSQLGIVLAPAAIAGALLVSTG